MNVTFKKTDSDSFAEVLGIDGDKAVDKMNELMTYSIFFMENKSGLAKLIQDKLSDEEIMYLFANLLNEESKRLFNDFLNTKENEQED